MIIAQNKLVTSSYFLEHQLLVSHYKGRVNLDLALEQGQTLLAFYETNKVKRSIIDVTGLYGSFVKLMEYYKVGYPTAVKSGLKFLAYVVSDDIINNNLIEKMCKLANSFGVEAKVFTSYEEAEAWVKSKG